MDPARRKYQIRNDKDVRYCDGSVIGRVEESSYGRILFAYKLAPPVITIARCNVAAIEAIAEISA